jgi:transcriptional regulator with XRE-family HTH domain
MPTQGDASFSERLRAVLSTSRMPQAALARELNIDASQVNRWVNGKSVPHLDMVRRIEKILSADLTEAFTNSTSTYELFVSAPISGIASDDIAVHYDAVAKVVAAASRHVNGVFWSGELFKSAADRRSSAADIVTQRNLVALQGCSAYLYLQFAEIIGPTSALVELGLALGRRMKITIITKSGLATPYMFRGFGAVAASLSFLPMARIYEVESEQEASDLITMHGRELLGLA